jgi:hypothetical protein
LDHERGGSKEDFSGAEKALGEGEEVRVPNRNWREERKELVAKRDLLFKNFQANPMDISLAQGIKKLDDQIAVCEEQLSREQTELRA